MKCPKCFSDNPDTKPFCADCGAFIPATEGVAPDQPLPTMTLDAPVESITRGMLFANRYEIIEELGSGGMGRVYRVEDKKIDQEVALKLIKSEIAADGKTMERFRNELKTARMIAHKNVCRMFDLGETSSATYITMEYVSGKDLKSLIRQVGRLDTGTAVRMTKQICEGLAEAHRLGVVHRDLKPSNIMIDREGTARIMDFGIARSLKAKGMTGAGMVIGTPEYMSPEQAEAKEVDQRSDLYSLGVILFEMVTGRLPFEGDTPLSIAMKHKGQEPVAPVTLNPQIPEELSQLILKCLAKEKTDRYGTAEELLAELDNIKSGLLTTSADEKTEKTISKTPGKKPTSSREITLSIQPMKFVGAAAIVGVIIVAVAGLFLWSPWSPQAPAAVPTIENSIAVIGFENQTGDSTYDHLQKVFPNLLITSLEATGSFHVLTWERMRDISQQIREVGSDNIDRDLGFEICRREGIEALVIGTFTKLGEMFATDVKVYDVGTKNSLSSVSSNGEGEESILMSQIDEMSRGIVKSLGAAARGEKGGAADTHISEVTTSSLEAYNHFLSGVEFSELFYFEEAREAFEKAVEIDPTFASAYMELAMVYFQTENSRAHVEAIKKAREFSNKVTEKEKLFIEAAYASSVEFDFEKSSGLYKNLAAKFPREKQAYYWLGVIQYFWGAYDESIDNMKKALALDPRHGDSVNMIAYVYMEKGDYANAIEYFARYAALSPGQANPHDSLAEAYFMMGRLEESLEEYREALRIKPDFGSGWKVAYIYALKGNYAEALIWINEFIEKASVPGLKAVGHFWKGFYLYWLGNSQKSLDELRLAEEQAHDVGNEMMLARIQGFKGWIHYYRGESDLSREGFLELNTYMRENFADLESTYAAMYNMNIGLLALRNGELDLARSHLEKINDALEKEPNVDQDWLLYYRDLLHAEVLLAEGLPEEAAKVGKEIKNLKYPALLSQSAGILYNMPNCKDVVARAYEASGKLDRAVTEYERQIVFNPDDPARHLIHPLYHYRLGLLYEQQGLDDKAKEQYARFLELWKDADLDPEVVKDARDKALRLM